MKTSYNMKYIRGLCHGDDNLVSAWIADKKALMQQQLGCPFSCSLVGDRYRFEAVLDLDAVEPDATAEEVNQLIGCLDSSTSFASIHVDTGWPFPRVMRVAAAAHAVGLVEVQANREGRLVRVCQKL